MRFAKLRAVSQLYGIPLSTLYWWISRGLWPPTIKLGERAAVGSLDEADEIMRARAAGADDDEIRALVVRQVADRQSAARADRVARDKAAERAAA